MASPAERAFVEPVGPPLPSQGRSGRRDAGWTHGWGARTAAALVALLFAAPAAYLVVRSTAQAGELVPLWTSAVTLRPLLNSVAIASAVSVATGLLGFTLAWLTARTQVPAPRLWRVLLPLPLVIPSFIGAFALLAALAPGGLFAGVLERTGFARVPVTGFWGAFFVLTLLSYPYVYLPVSARLRHLPRALEESARLLGRSPGQTFLAVVLPQARSALWAGMLLVFLYVLSDFGAVQLLRYDTLTRAIYAARLYDPSLSLALALLLALLAILVVTVERRLARAVPPARGARALVLPLGRWKAPAVAFLVATTAFALVGPVAVLVFWAARGIVRGSTRASALVGDLGALVEPTLHTAMVSAAAAATALLAVLPVAYLTTRRRDALGAATNAVVVGGFALPGLVVALAVVFWTLQAPRSLGDLVYQTPGLLVFAYVVHFGAQALRTAQVAVATLPPRVEDAARTLGAGRWRRLRTIELPLMLPGLLAGAGLVFLSAAKELPATLLLAPPGFQTLATKVWSATEDAFLADASVAALLLVTVSGALTWLLVLRGRGEDT